MKDTSPYTAKYLKDYKKGCLVRAHYDGKCGRGTDCKVIRRRGFAILVEFIPWHFLNKKPIQKWFVSRKTDEYSLKYGKVYAAYVQGERSIHEGFFGLKGEYYSLKFI